MRLKRENLSPDQINESALFPYRNEKRRIFPRKWADDKWGNNAAVSLHVHKRGWERATAWLHISPQRALVSANIIYTRRGKSRPIRAPKWGRVSRRGENVEGGNRLGYLCPRTRYNINIGAKSIRGSSANRSYLFQTFSAEVLGRGSARAVRVAPFCVAKRPC